MEQWHFCKSFQSLHVVVLLKIGGSRAWDGGGGWLPCEVGEYKFQARSSDPQQFALLLIPFNSSPIVLQWKWKWSNIILRPATICAPSHSIQLVPNCSPMKVKVIKYYPPTCNNLRSFSFHSTRPQLFSNESESDQILSSDPQQFALLLIPFNLFPIVLQWKWKWSNIILWPATICAPSSFLHCVELEVVNVFDIVTKKNRILLYLLFAVKGEMPYIGTSIFSCSINLPLPAGKQ